MSARRATLHSQTRSRTPPAGSASVAAHEFGPAFEVAAATGIRRGELCGLSWDAVNLERGTLTIVQSLVQLAGHWPCPHCQAGHDGLLLTVPKTAAGEGRTVELDTTTIGTLMEHSLRQAERRAAFRGRVGRSRSRLHPRGRQPAAAGPTDQGVHQAVRGGRGPAGPAARSPPRRRQSAPRGRGGSRRDLQAARSLLDRDHRRHLQPPARGRGSRGCREGDGAGPPGTPGRAGGTGRRLRGAPGAHRGRTRSVTIKGSAGQDRRH